MKGRLFLIFIVICLFFNGGYPDAHAAQNSIDDLNDFIMRINNTNFEKEISINGFSIIQNQVYSVIHNEFGEIKLIPAMDTKYQLIILFFADINGNIIFKTYNLQCNFLIQEQFKQSAKGVSSVSFTDLNGDGLLDIILIYSCDYENSQNTFNVGDVLFQNSKGFYRDFRISDKINRFDMNKNVNAIEDYVKDGKSAEFLYTSETLGQLIDNGFNVIKSQSFDVHLEKFGVAQLVPGFYNMAGQNYLMIYLINSDGNILWNFQPMQDHMNFFSIKACSFIDVNGDGLKDINILASYIDIDEKGNASLVIDFNIYYQEAGYFIEDTEFKSNYTFKYTDGLPNITQKAREFWGWR